MVDGETELFSSVALPGVIVYNYRLVNVLASEIDAGAIRELESGVVTQACSTPGTKDGLLEMGVTWRFSYHGRMREHIASLDVTPSDCGF